MLYVLFSFSPSFTAPRLPSLSGLLDNCSPRCTPLGSNLRDGELAGVRGVGTETQKLLEFNGRKTYRENFERELKEIHN